MMGDLKALIRRKPIVAAWLVVFFGDVSMNFMTGYEILGLVLAGILAAIAFLGAYGAHQQSEAQGAKRAGWLTAAVLAICVGFFSGWQQMGLRFDRAMGSLDAQATGHNTIRDQLAAARKERDALGMQRPASAIAADLALEQRRTSRNYPDGCGPNCTKLKNELANANRAAELDAALPDMTKAMKDGDSLTNADAPFQVVMTLSSAAASVLMQREVKFSARDVVFGFEVFIVFVVVFFGIAGPWLLDLRPDGGAGAPAAAVHDWGPKRLTFAPVTDGDAVPQLAPHAPPAAGFEPSGRQRDNSVAPVLERAPGGFLGGQPGGDGLNQPPASPAHVTGGNLHGAPVTIHFNAPPPAALSGPVINEVPRDGLDHAADRNVAKLRAVPQRLEEVPVEVAAPDVPVDRSALNAMLDGLAVFKAAATLPQRGAWLRADDLYRRYAEWAQTRAIAEETFLALFGEVTGTPMRSLNGVPHYMGVVLKTPRLALAAEG